MKSFSILLLACALLLSSWQASSFSLVMMGARRGKGGLKRSLDDTPLSSKKKSPMNSLNEGRGQEITGVTLPEDGEIRGWEFGKQQRLACTSVGGRYFALQGACPRCAFDLWKGDLLTDQDVWDDCPRVACPTCATTYSFRTGERGPPLKRKGLAGFVGGLAKTATTSDEFKNAKAFIITKDDDGRIFMREQ